MSDSTTNLPPIVVGTNADVRINEALDASSPASIYGRNAATCANLTWGYLGGRWGGFSIANGTNLCGASTTTYMVVAKATGVVSFSTSTTNWNDATNYARAYKIVTGTLSVSSYEDHRAGNLGTQGGTSSGGSFTGGTLTSALNEAPQVALASASTVNIGAAAANTVTVSGTTTITAFDSIATGAIRRVRFLGVLTLTHNATTLILPGSASITTAAGDVATMESLGSGNWRCINYSKADGTAVVGGAGSGTVTSVDATGGVETDSGSAITSTGTIRLSELVNAQTGTTYTYLTGDRGKVVTHSNASAIAATLPQATGTFPAGWRMIVKNKGAGTLTITPTTSTIDGAATLVLTTGQWAIITSDGTNYQAMAYAPSGGGLTGATSALNTASPNSSVNVSSISASGGTTIQDLALVPKANGALMAQVPDNTSAGGNRRGQNAVDWQTSRSAATAVANGQYAIIPGGSGNTASGTGSSAIGVNNSSTGLYATAICVGNTSSGDFSASIGTGNTAVGNASVAMGDSANSRVRGSIANASGNFSVAGDAQFERLVHRRATSSATPAAMSADGSAPGATTCALLSNNSVVAFEVVVTAKVSTFGDRATYKLTGQISRGANAAATQIDGTPTVTTIATIGGASAWAVAASANTTLGSLEITVTGVAATTIRWVASIELTEVVG